MPAAKTGGRLQCYLAEYDRLRGEIVERLRIQKEVERSQVLLIAALVAAASLIWDKQVYIVLLFGSALFLIVGTAFFEQDINIAILASYLHRQLRPSIVAELAGEEKQNEVLVLNWERFRHDEFLRTAISSVLTINRTLLTYLPGFATFGTYFYLKYGTSLIPRPWNEIEVMLTIVNFALALFLIILGVKVPRMYHEVAPRQ